MPIVNTHKNVQEYYSKTIKKTSDLKTNACCTLNKPPSYITEKLRNIHPNILSSYYGCGLIMPSCLKSTKILDLGCGTGRDVYLLSQLSGNTGHVIGIDMTDEQLHTARQYKQYHMDICSPHISKVEFKKGNIERLDELQLSVGSFDVIVSNCVINLCMNKEYVLKEIYKLLKDGGEFYFSDVYSNRRIPEHLRNDHILYGECLSGALYWNDFLHLARQCGFADPRLVTSKPITINNDELQHKTGDIQFYSATYRLFKSDKLESDCEDYGQAVIYKGTIEHHQHSWNLDNHHCFYTNKVIPVCGNTWNILKLSRFNSHFTFVGDFSMHFGIFDGCGKTVPFEHVNTNKNCC